MKSTLRVNHEDQVRYARVPQTMTALDRDASRQLILASIDSHGDGEAALRLADHLESEMPAHAAMIHLHHSDATSFPGSPGGFKMRWQDLHGDAPVGPSSPMQHSTAISTEPRGLKRVLLRVPGDGRSIPWITYGATLPAEQARQLHEALVQEGARRASV